MTSLWYTWFLFIAIFLIWQHFSKMWLLKGAVSSAWAWVSWPCTSVSPDYKIFWEWYHRIHLFHWFWVWVLCLFVFNEEISQQGGQREIQTFCIWLWCCCSYEADAACNCLCSQVCLYAQSPATVCLHTSPSNDLALLRSLETQDLWRNAMGPQKAQVVTPRPWQSCNLCGIRSLLTAIRGVEGKASQLPEQGFQVTVGHFSELPGTSEFREVD